MKPNFARVGVGVMIFNDKDQILFGKRHDDPEKADSELHGEGTWTMPGGKLDFQEKPKESAIREVLEETSLEVKGLEFMSLTNDVVPDAHFLTIGFICRDFKGEPKVMEPDEITKWQWFDIDNLPEKVFSPSQKILDNYLAKRIYFEN